jgi:hypothetical protein
MLKFRRLNAFWLLAPVLVWNIVMGPRLAHPGFGFDNQAAPWLLISENILRLPVMALPILLPLGRKTGREKIGLGVYLVGLLLYLAGWIPLISAPSSAWSNSLAGFLAPAYTPLLWLLGIGLVGGWWPYLLLAAAFVAVHLAHWIEVFQIYSQG